MKKTEIRQIAWLFAGMLALSGCSESSAGTASSLAGSQNSAQQIQTTASSQTDSAAREQEIITLHDDLDREVTLKRPERVAVLIGSFADLLSDAGGKEQIVAAAHDTWTSFDLDLKDAADLGDVKNISQETLIASKPDLVIASAKNDSQKKMLDLLEDAGIPVVYYDVSAFEDYLRVLEQMSKITGDTRAFTEHGEKQKQQIEEIQNTDHKNPPTVLALRETGKGIKALGSDDSVLGAMLDDLDTTNIAGKDGLDTLSMEYILQQNPDMIFYVAQGKTLDQAKAMADSLFSSDPWNELDAVKNDRVFVLDQRLYNLKPNARWASALEDLETMIYGASSH